MKGSLKKHQDSCETYRYYLFSLIPQNIFYAEILWILYRCTVGHKKVVDSREGFPSWINQFFATHFIWMYSDYQTHLVFSPLDLFLLMGYHTFEKHCQYHRWIFIKEYCTASWNCKEGYLKEKYSQFIIKKFIDNAT